jgi:predicted cupin superfamily sugar epimerase
MSPPDLSAEDVARLLDLAPHPEGGFYKETFRDPREIDERSVGTAIYYLLPAGQVSQWHRVDAGEIWHWHAGAPLELSLDDGARRTTLRLGSDLLAGERPQGIVPAGVWQSAKSLGAWTLVGCTVSPGFEFAHFELAPPGFDPPA